MSRPDDQPRVSVVVPCYGHADCLGACLASLIAQRPDQPFEIVLAHSGDDAGLQETLAGFKRVRLVRSPRPLLPGDARKLGVEAARGELIVFLDADCVAEPGYVAAAVAAFNDPVVKLVGGPVLDARPWQPICAADNLSQFADFPPGRPDGPAEYFPGCNMAVRRADFLAIGGFPASPFPAGEDTLLCFVVEQRWPGSLRFVNAMRMRHTGRSTLTAYLRHQAAFGFTRGSMGIKVSPRQQRLGTSWLLAVPVAVKRFAYMLGQTRRYHPRGLLRVALLTPILIPGYLAWSVGFRRGCRSALASPKPPAETPA